MERDRYYRLAKVSGRALTLVCLSEKPWSVKMKRSQRLFHQRQIWAETYRWMPDDTGWLNLFKENVFFLTKI
jgi:hypothetical protein